MADPAKELFEEFRQEQLARIDRCVEEKQKESLYLDFKQSIDDHGFPTGDLTKDGRKVLSENLSAFANAGGGILVWGIRDNGHCASKKIPIPNVEKFVTELTRATQQSLNPPLDGIEHIFIEEESGSGYAVTYIPEGKAKPYMAVQYTEQFTYYLRVGDSSKPMPDAAVRAFVMAGSLPSMALKHELMAERNLVTVQISLPGGRGRAEPGIKSSLHLTLVNDGSVIVEHPAVALAKVEGCQYPSRIGKQTTVLEVEGRQQLVEMYRLEQVSPLYPGETVNLHLVGFELERESYQNGFCPIRNFSMDYWLFAKNYSRKGTILIARENIRAM